MRNRRKADNPRRQLGRPKGPARPPVPVSPAPVREVSTDSENPAASRVDWQSLLHVTFLLMAVVLPILRAANLLALPWAAALAPFTIAGVIVAIVSVRFVLQPKFEMLRALLGNRAASPPLTPAPDALAAPAGATDPDQRILGEHPELLAALCHGFRMAKLRPTVLLHPVTDPWGVYRAALQASTFELAELTVLARLHAQRSATLGARALRRKPSDAEVLKQTLRQFQRCAVKAVAGRTDPDCTFEHVTTIFGTRSPNRDLHLKSIMPRVRALLEHMYPQLATAQLADGSPVEFARWQQQAAEERKALAHLQKEHDRVVRRLASTESELATARQQREALHAEMQTAQKAARAAAFAEADQTIRQLQASLQHSADEITRQLHRAEAEEYRLTGIVTAVSAERDALERALLDSSEQDESAEPAPTADLAGLRILLAGGNEGYLPNVRAQLEAHGVQVLHAEGPSALDLVATVHLVVLWTRFMNHPTYYALKRECKIRGIPHCYWTRTSPASLLELIARSRAGIESPHSS